ncbi:Pectinesterase inhibitor domain [Arabidopsis suecica]|uniref:Pectinesterase inhibitor domain n=1 Tax=Arabidopsis suecica TaxID=45249 RepID=A0A8T2CA35_ARASU|nr:Pectinesterase inhibitor domain [Arabidopsis suecica]
MNFAPFVFLMIVLVLYIFTPHIEGVEADGPTEALINSICIENEDYGFCNKIIHEKLKTPTATIKELTSLIIYTTMAHASDTYIFIDNILRKWPGPKEMSGLKTCHAVYKRETNSFLEIRFLFSKGEYELMDEAILSTAKILEECRGDFLIPPYKEPLLEKKRVMRILITMSAVSGHMVKNEKASLISSVVTAQFFNI